MDSPLLALPHAYRAFYGSFLSLRPAQRACVEPLLAGRDLVLQAATGSGKTEAVLAPCLERMIQEGRSWSAIYVVPTRALAEDLLRRVTAPIRDKLGLSIAVRTGDRRRRGSGRPDVLLTTPESLDIALGGQDPEIRGLLARAGAVILDEAHAYAGQPRGAQLRALLIRLSRRAGRPLQRIALSATLAEPAAIIAGFDLRPEAEVLVFPGGPSIRSHLVHLQGEDDLRALVEDLADQYGHRKLLLFTDSRGRCERLFAALNERGRFRGRCELHYSNLSPAERRGVEARLRERREALCIATSTLELGIDVGDVDAAVLYGPPPSAAAFLQRVGRSGRRKGESVVWGICHGEEAGEQLLRFLGLLRLARRGEAEVLRPAVFPSVLAQQVLSCVHERQRVSLPALQDLFPREAATLAQILPALEAKGWLKREPTGLLAGGWRFFEARIERRLWSNFPLEEPPFSLAVDEEILAEIPAKVAAQLEVGQRVQLAGRRLRVLDIDPGERRRIDATPTLDGEAEELSWIGMSAPVSYEAAQAVREVLADRAEEPALWARTAHLLAQERARAVAVLANGVEVYREVEGAWRYRTYLGTFGNLVLREAIRRAQGEDGGDLWSDPLGVTSERWVDFRALELPRDAASLRAWTALHRGLLQATLPLGAFCAALPEPLLADELLLYLNDLRLLAAFSRYAALPSTVASGDRAALEIPQPPPPLPRKPASFPASGPRPLEEARQRQPAPPPLTFAAPRRATATRLASWIRQDQCERFLSWSARAEQRPPLPTSPARAAAGQAHEARVLADLARAHRVEVVAATRPDGSLRSLEERRAETAARLQALAAEAEAAPGALLYLAGPVFLSEGLLPGGLAGVPDLLALSWGPGGLRIAPGDIKSSADARYDQKWQVALYALLLAERGLLPEAEPEGFLVLRPSPGEARWLRFALAPWLEIAPRLLALAREIIEADPSVPPWRLGSWCASCPFEGACSSEALAREEVQLLPALSRGEREALRRQGIARLEEAEALEEGALWGTIPGRARALARHRIELAPPALPSLPPGAVFGVEIEEDPATGLPSAFGLLDLERERGQRWPAADLPLAWSALLNALERCFGAAPDPGAWLAVYGARQRRLLESLAARYSPDRWRALLRDPSAGERRLLDLRRLVLDSVRLPAPGAASLHMVGRVLGLSPALSQPDSLLRAVGSPADGALERLRVMAGLWRWLRGKLASAAPPAAPIDAGGSDAAVLLRFLERERSLRRASILAVQALPLPERVARFRALGPLTLEETALDAEGNLVHRFRSAQPIGATRLREGDFLRLAPLGLADLQAGLPVILESLDPMTGSLCLRLRGASRSPRRGLPYSLEEDLTDWSYPALVEVVQEVAGAPFHPAAEMLHRPSPRLPPEEEAWARGWLAAQGGAASGPPLGAKQAEALLLAFQRSVALIEGPPGTGKTWLLARILLALLQRALEQGRPFRVAVTALTHQAIDQALAKLAALLAEHPSVQARVRVAKLGRQREDSPGEPLHEAAEVQEEPWLVLGATGQGLRRLLGSSRQVFDLVACDEASQLLLPQAWLALAHGKGRCVFIGDTRQLPPVIQGSYEDEPRPLHRSILAHLLERQPSVRLEQSHRLNDGLCAFPSRAWYEGTLRPAPAVAEARLVPARPPRGDALDAILAPDPPAALVLLEHQGRREQSPEEANLLALLVERLLERYELGAERIAVLSPHRAQNNLIREALAARLGPAPLPLIDTVERLQGAERDVVLFGLTSSDPDRLESAFLTDPRRFNVAITRARLKLIVAASEALFSVLPHSEEALLARRHLLAFERFCAERGGLFRYRAGGNPAGQETPFPPEPQ